MRKATGFIVTLALIFLCCSGEDDAPTRPYRMGMQNSAPRYDDIDLVLQSLEIWTSRADAAMITTEVPWEELLAGDNAVDYVVNNYADLVHYYREKNLKLWIFIDPQNGLDRTSDALELQAVNKSIADSDMQALYRRFVFVMDSVLKPEHLGLALETNLIRSASPSTYDGVKVAANMAAAEIRMFDADVKLSISVQVDHAWGKLVGGSFVGIEQDFVDFPFVEELGLSSYPYFGFDTPEEIPENYYTRLIEGKTIPVFVAEGGWTSTSVNSPDISFTSSPQLQQRYVNHHARLLKAVRATALFQLVFTDIDLNHLPPGTPDNINYFANLGLVDIQLKSKPALQAWDKLFKTPLDEQ